MTKTEEIFIGQKLWTTQDGWVVVGKKTEAINPELSSNGEIIENRYYLWELHNKSGRMVNCVHMDGRYHPSDQFPCVFLEYPFN